MQHFKTLFLTFFLCLTIIGCATMEKRFDVLLHMEEEVGSPVITDSSNNPKLVNAYGNAEISTEQAKFGSSSLYLDGSLSNYVTIQNSSDWDFGSGDFTIDCWFYITDTRGQKTIFAGSTDWWLAA